MTPILFIAFIKLTLCGIIIRQCILNIRQAKEIERILNSESNREQEEKYLEILSKRMEESLKEYRKNLKSDNHKTINDKD